jgi:Zn-finger nucleic acid-binding protein
MCPDCGELLIIFELDGVETDHCLACGGTWLDAGELEQIILQAGADPVPLAENLASAGKGRRSQRKCPRCSRKMRLIHVGLDSAVELDRCPRGHGYWLDRGEMEAVAKIFQEGAGGAVAAYFSDLYPMERRDRC